MPSHYNPAILVHTLKTLTYRTYTQKVCRATGRTLELPGQHSPPTHLHVLQVEGGKPTHEVLGGGSICFVFGNRYYKSTHRRQREKSSHPGPPAPTQLSFQKATKVTSFSSIL